MLLFFCPQALVKLGQNRIFVISLLLVKVGQIRVVY